MATGERAAATGFRHWLSTRSPAICWRVALAAVLVGWWHVLATAALLGGWNAHWWAWRHDVDLLRDAPWQLVAWIVVGLGAALLGPWALPRRVFRPLVGARAWLAAIFLVCLLPQLWMTVGWLLTRVFTPVDPTLAGRPTQPVLWIVVESADVGVHLPKVDARRHDYFSVVHDPTILRGRVAGVWAQICGSDLDAAWSGTTRRCLVDEGWRVIHGRDSPRLSALLASTGAEVAGGRHFGGQAPAGTVPDAVLLQAAAAADESRPHALVLAGGAAASDAAMDAAIGEWLDRGGIALVTTNRARPHRGWDLLPVRLYGVGELALPAEWDLAQRFGRAAPGRLMGGLSRGSLYDAGCTAWELAGFGCRGVGYGIALTRDVSTTWISFRSAL